MPNSDESVFAPSKNAIFFFLIFFPKKKQMNPIYTAMILILVLNMSLLIGIVASQGSCVQTPLVSGTFISRLNSFFRNDPSLVQWTADVIEDALSANKNLWIAVHDSAMKRSDLVDEVFLADVVSLASSSPELKGRFLSKCVEISTMTFDSFPPAV